MISNRFMEVNNSDFTNTYEEENIIEGKKVFNDIKNIYWFITFIVFGLYYYSLLYNINLIFE